MGKDNQGRTESDSPSTDLLNAMPQESAGDSVVVGTVSSEALVQESVVQEAVAKAEQAGLPEQIPLAIVSGQPLMKLPDDLYIPPDALEIFLEAFEGPLDLLLYLIKRNNMDILNIQVAAITSQYMQYVDLMESSQFELAAEYLVMAATLAEIKSRMLLPRQVEAEDEEEDPRAELIRRLQEYERFKKAAEGIDELPRVGRNIYKVKIDPPQLTRGAVHPDVDLREVLVALGEVIKRAEMFEEHHIQAEALSTRERMTQVLERLRGDTFVPFVTLFTLEEGRLGVVVTFLAIMELIKESLVELVQTEAYGPIHVKARAE
ncbi:segregation and condensation protein A [Parendozoicomonas haliclonae]|uniref:Segregation and condensation protein A n=1 Tax=Parendozoicomonas haliclonae TaxID=1960125 RepID=A0A1X7AQZ6_9GAMM|nr:ScpA family protein [Parendozoicomonas haliclonae]SMA50518.1 Segregation and condensation protein A [Parendozoicomonas haliclonae]